MSRRKRVSLRLGSPRRLGLYAVGIGVWLSGGLWLWFHYLLVKQGEFGPQTHPLEPWWLRLHGAFAFGAIWIFGLLWGVHITTAWPFRHRRRSGGLMAGILFWLTLSGYLLYYVGNETARPFISVLHWSIGLACPLAFFWHRFKRRKRETESSTLALAASGQPDDFDS